MERGYADRHSSWRLVALAVVAVLHALAVYGLTTGLARKAVEMIRKPVQVAIAEEIKPTPPPLPTPPPKILPQAAAPKQHSIPPPFVPPPEVALPPTTAAPVITTVTNTPPIEAPVIAPPPPVPPAPAPAPAPVPAPERTSAIAVACPTQVKPEIPREALQHGVSGTVKARILINAGVVKNVTILSGPRELHSAVRTAIRQYKCVSSGGDVVAEQEFEFKIE